MSEPFKGDLVRWRMENGSLCHLCPLRGCRRVGCDGPLDAPIVIMAEAPGKDEEADGRGQREFGRPLVGRSGYMAKVKFLAPAGLATLEERSFSAWPKVKSLKAFLCNVVMCRPPGNKINSVEGRLAVACCRNSAINLLKELWRRDPNRVLITFGETSLHLIEPKAKISKVRGRVLDGYGPDDLQLWDEDAIAKRAAKGLARRLPSSWKEHEKVIKWFLAFTKSEWRKRLRERARRDASRRGKRRRESS